jgi:hypothetical protein
MPYNISNSLLSNKGAALGDGGLDREEEARHALDLVYREEPRSTAHDALGVRQRGRITIH